MPFHIATAYATYANTSVESDWEYDSDVEDFNREQEELSDASQMLSFGYDSEEFDDWCDE